MSSTQISLSLFIHELKSHYKYALAWIIGINAYFLMAVAIYPGEQAVMDFLGLFEEELFKALLGEVGGDAPAYRIWLSMMLPFITVAAFIFASMMGVRLAVGAITDDTGELIHPQPITRLQFLSVRFAVGIIIMIVMMLVSAIFLLVPVEGHSVPVDYVFKFTWWGIFFLVATLSFGMVFGVLAADTGRGYMFTLFFSIFLYAFQAAGRLVPELEDIAEYNPLNWYQPGNVILEGNINEDFLVYIAVFLVVGTIAANLLFLKRDLIKEASIPIPLLSRISRRGKNSKRSKGKSDKDKLLTLWARPLERKLPFTADFIYSDRKALLIVFWALILFYPAQLMSFQPNDAEFIANLQGTIASFGNSGILKIFTYGHDLSSDIWLWFLITQAVGNHYFILLPLSAHWIKKTLKSDAESLTGEIIGAMPIDSTRVMLQRLLAILLELLFIVLQMVLWLVLSELAIEVESNTTWEIIAILGVIPLYIFLISAGLTLGLLLKNGVKYARYSLVVLILWFIAGISLDENSGLFGMYDPVLIIQEESLSVVNYGVVWLTGFAVIFSIIIILLAPRYDWLDIPKADPNIISS